ncbi:hypothetical protein GO755_10465 [Spirosoma sp. HMF4905]|uniref:CheB-type methylesterase domain-containing protein n=1 Tax=Spirosoma arboris TaxID=2682092 RepID=A0A7K1S9G7_9BACT|nr:hypothetical protein [Spirosoma arboris]MVM30457.1 hypothetical protein [Spirosoma arboris]
MVEKRDSIVIGNSTEAEVPSMPENTIQRVVVDYVLPAAQLASQLTRLVEQTVSQ